MEDIYNWEEFKEVLIYLGFNLDKIYSFEEYYQNLREPIINFEEFIQFKGVV